MPVIDAGTPDPTTNLMPEPPTSGRWVRLPDGSLQPEDESTAQLAGLPWPIPTATEQPE